MPSLVKRQRFLVTEQAPTLLGWYQAYIILCVIGNINILMYLVRAFELVVLRLPHICVRVIMPHRMRFMNMDVLAPEVANQALDHPLM